MLSSDNRISAPVKLPINGLYVMKTIQVPFVIERKKDIKQFSRRQNQTRSVFGKYWSTCRRVELE